MSVSARRAALQALLRYEKNGAWPLDTLEAILQREKPEPREAALARRICLTVMQNTTLLDAWIDRYSATPCRLLDREVACILRLSAAQILLMTKIPAHAAVSEGVALCRTCGKKSAAGLVNAVLRRLTEGKGTLPPLPEEETERLSVLYSHPLWLVRRFYDALGPAGCEAALAADNTEPETDLQVNPRRCGTEELLQSLAAEGRRARLHPWLPDCCTVQGGDIASLESFRKGWFYVQDAAAHCAVLAAGLRPGMFVVDGCAAPGGKTAAAALAVGPAGRVLACDIQEKKLRKIEENCRRLGLDRVETRQADGRVFDPALEKAADAVLADVPCSGLGVIRKKPEIRLKTEAEIAGLPAIQRAILENLSRYVRPGGVLIYSTCTVLEEENEGVIRAFLAGHPEFAPEDFPLPGPAVCRDGCVTFWQGRWGTDGFFLCRLRRRQETGGDQ